MIALMWNLSVAHRRYLRTYMPSNIVIDQLRTRRGLKWAVPVAVVAVPTYLSLAGTASCLVDLGRTGVDPHARDPVRLLGRRRHSSWNAMKFAATGAWSAVQLAVAAARAVLLRMQ